MKELGTDLFFIYPQHLHCLVVYPQGAYEKAQERDLRGSMGDGGSDHRHDHRTDGEGGQEDDPFPFVGTSFLENDPSK